LTAVLPNTALERDVAKSAAPLSFGVNQLLSVGQGDLGFSDPSDPTGDAEQFAAGGSPLYVHLYL
jgi:hypothetical protein